MWASRTFLLANFISNKSISSDKNRLLHERANTVSLAAETMWKPKELLNISNNSQSDEVNSLPLFERKWVRAPESRLSTTTARRDWFRLVQLNYMTDCWNDLSCQRRSIEKEQSKHNSVDECNNNTINITKDHRNNNSNNNINSNNNNVEESELNQFYVPCRPFHRATSVCGVRLRSDHHNSKSFVNNEDSINTYQVEDSLPRYVSPEYRQQHLLTLLRHYDPDLVMLNEINRLFFHEYLWKHIRYLGYGMLYTSSRGAYVKVSNQQRVRHNFKKNNLFNLNNQSEYMSSTHRTAKSHQTYYHITAEEDIGNVILFHKGRFFPILMPGEELPRHLYFAHIAGLRDRVTNMTLNVALVQFTAGHSKEAAALRAYEARQTLLVLDAMNRNDADRAHMSNIVCGDFNNVEMDEECVKLMHERFFSAYDLVGGPRWTTWHCNDSEKSQQYEKCYYNLNVKNWKENNLAQEKESEIQDYLKNRAICIECFRENPREQNYNQDQKCNKAQTLISSCEEKSENSPLKNDKKLIQDEKIIEHKEGISSSYINDNHAEEQNEITTLAKYDAMEVIKKEELARGIVKRTQDYIFYEPFTLALHNVLDLPDAKNVINNKLLPNALSPSHHIPLIVDVSFNNVFPEVTDISTKPEN